MLQVTASMGETACWVKDSTRNLLRLGTNWFFDGENKAILC
jgi:hypothetical protein